MISQGKYFAPPGQEKQNYRIHGSYNPKNMPLYAKHEERFGVGQDAVKDAKIDPLFKCSSEGVGRTTTSSGVMAAAAVGGMVVCLQIGHARRASAAVPVHPMHL